MDIAVADLNFGLSVLLGNGDGSFQPALISKNGLYNTVLTVGDFNMDGNADIVVTNYTGVSVLLGNGDGTFQAPASLSTASSPASIAVGDFNGDGKPDLAVGDGAAGVAVLLGNGVGTFNPITHFGAGIYGPGLAIGDFNGDGRPDIAFSNGALSVGNGDGTFQAPESYPTGYGPSSIAVADFNGDGKLDIAAGGNYGVNVLMGNGDGTFQKAVSYGTGPATIAIGDFNGDSKPDIFVANQQDYALNVLLAEGDGKFVQAAETYSLGFPTSGLVVGSLDSQGRAEVIAANSSGDVSVVLGFPPSPKLSAVITHSGNFTQGQSGAVFTIIVSNIGSAPTSGMATLTDSLPSELTATGISGAGWTCTLATLTCTRSDILASAESYPAISLTVSVAANAPGGVTNTVSISGSGGAAGGSPTDFTTTFTQSEVSGAWTPLSPPAALNNAGAPLLMTDGTILVQQYCSGAWYRLVPDSFGNYTKGAWSQVASLPSGYSPYSFSSAVLADGRVVVIGGEYNNPCTSPVWTNLGAIYDSIANSWAALPAPGQWIYVGDAQNTILPNGQFLLASIGTLYAPNSNVPAQTSSQLAALDPVTLQWTIRQGAGKADGNDEEGWTMLPDGTLLTVDVYNPTPMQSERYFPQQDKWVSAGSTVVPLISGKDTGPQVLRPDGTVIAVGATGHTSMYTVASGAWTAGPDFPVSNGYQILTEDAPATLLPSGNVLVAVDNTQQDFYFEFDGARMNPVPAPPNTVCGYFLPLPNGQVLCTGGGVAIYTPSGSPSPAWAPKISLAPAAVQPGMTYAVMGTQFNGLSQAAGYGDDYQGATNYPLVRITNTATGHVFYCRTHGHSNMGVATGATPVSTEFDVPASIETGPSTLVVVANGIPSQPWNTAVAAAQTPGEPTIQNVQGAGLSVPAVTSISANGFFTVFGQNLAPAGTSRSVASADIVNGSLPTNLASTCVYAGPTPAFLTYVSPTQINGIAPQLAIIAPVLATYGSAGISVVAHCGTLSQNTSNVFNAPIVSASPEFLYWTQNTNGQDPVIAVDAVHGDNIGPPGLIPGLTLRPARAGDVLTIYGIGFGSTASGPIPGAIAPAADSVPAGYSVTIGGTPVPASYAGVTPTVAGLYQLNITVPSGLTPGNDAIVLTVNGASTPTGGIIAIGE